MSDVTLLQSQLLNMLIRDEKAPRHGVMTRGIDILSEMLICLRDPKHLFQHLLVKPKTRKGLITKCFYQRHPNPFLRNFPHDVTW